MPTPPFFTSCVYFNFSISFFQYLWGSESYLFHFLSSAFFIEGCVSRCQANYIEQLIDADISLDEILLLFGGRV